MESTGEFRYEKTISPREWFEIRANDSISNKHFPRYQYNPVTSRMIVQLSPSPLHESVVSSFSSGFTKTITNLPRPLQNDFQVSTNKEFVGFEGRYVNAVKTPDMAFQVKNTKGFFEPLVVLEVGVSQTQDELREIVDLWMSFRTIRFAVIVNVVEEPRYKSPESSIDLPQRLSDVQQNDFISQSQYGPVKYKGYTFVNSITHATIEIWSRRGMEGRWDLLSLPYTTFLPIIDDSDLRVNLDVGTAQSYIKTALKELALARLARVLKPS